jgi:tetrahydromethanopterin S-methyltransferase subunit G
MFMPNATLSPRELAALLARLDEAQRTVEAIRAQLIQAMAARRRPPARRTPRRPK